MTEVQSVGTPSTAVSVAQAKRKLAAWGDSADASVASTTKRLGSAALNLGGVLAATGLVALVVRRMLPSRFNAVSRLASAAARAANSLQNGQPPHRRNSTMIGKVGWMALPRVARWLLPHAIEAVRSIVGTKKSSDGVPSARHVS